MYSAQIIGKVYDKPYMNNNKLTSRIVVTFNNTNFYIQLIFNLEDRKRAEMIKKNDTILVVGKIVKSLYKKNSVQYTNETMYVDNFYLINCDKNIDNNIENIYHNDNYDDF